MDPVTTIIKPNKICFLLQAIVYVGRYVRKLYVCVYACLCILRFFTDTT